MLPFRSHTEGVSSGVNSPLYPCKRIKHNKKQETRNDITAASHNDKKPSTEGVKSAAASRAPLLSLQTQRTKQSKNKNNGGTIEGQIQIQYKTKQNNTRRQQCIILIGYFRLVYIRYSSSPPGSCPLTQTNHAQHRAKDETVCSFVYSDTSI